jgi:hypothetical protein
MDMFVVFIGSSVCVAGGLAIVAAAWWYALKMLFAALKNTALMALFFRWALIKHIRNVRREERKALKRMFSHTQKAKPNAR